MTASHEPRRLGRYELLYLLGQGGMGEVHLAKLTGTAGFEKLCIVKTILPNMQADPQFVDRFHHEARVLVQLNHSNIAQVYDMGEVDGTLYMAIEYVPGVDLSRVLSRSAAHESLVPIEVGAFLGRQICEALDYAHRRTGPDGAPLGIVHRDVSPQNVMVSYEGDVKVIDFGLAKSKGRSQHTLPSTVLGKLGYMSPEQAMARSLDHRSDIYSAGIVIWEVLAGRPAFGGATMGELLAMMANPNIPSLRSVRADVSETLDRVVMRALAPDPAQRYSRAEEFSRSLNEIAVRESLSVSSEQVGNYVRSMCADEFAAERRLQSQLSLMRRRGATTDVTPALESGERDDLGGTLIRKSGGEVMTPAQRALSVATPAPRAATPAPRGRSQVAQGTPSGPQPRQSVEAAPSDGEIRVPRSQGPLIGAAIVGLAVVGGATWFALSGSPEPTRPEPAGPPVAVLPEVPVKAPAKAPVAEAPVVEAVKPALPTLEVTGTVFNTVQEDGRVYILLAKGQVLTEGDPLILVGAPVEGTRRPKVGTAVVDEVKRSKVKLLASHEGALPAEVFAVLDATPKARVAVVDRRQPEKAPERTAERAPEKAPEKTPERAPEKAPEKTPERQPEKAPEKAPVVVAQEPVHQLPVGGPQGTPGSLQPTPFPGQGSTTATAAPAGARPVLRGTIHVSQLGKAFPKMVKLRNANAQAISGCEVRFENRKVWRFSARDRVSANDDIEIEANHLLQDTAAPLQFPSGFALLNCREGVGWVQLWGAP